LEKQREMKTNLRDRILELLAKAKERRDILIRHMKSYAEYGNYSDANICKIKKDEIDLFIENLEEILK
jgi:hypothetical protein